MQTFIHFVCIQGTVTPIEKKGFPLNASIVLQNASRYSQSVKFISLSFYP